MDKNLIFFNFLLINLNPYITRFYIAVPTIINDLIFILGTLIIVYFIIEDKQKLTSFILGCIFVFASSTETFGISLLEAMAVGMPIVCSDKSSLPEVLQNGGLYFDFKK